MLNFPNTLSDICSGQWVAVIYDDVWFPGVVENSVSGTLTVKFMCRRQLKHFVWPDITDRQTVLETGVLCKIRSPYSVNSRYFAFHDNDDTDALCLTVLAR